MNKPKLCFSAGKSRRSGALTGLLVLGGGKWVDSEKCEHYLHYMRARTVLYIAGSLVQCARLHYRDK